MLRTPPIIGKSISPISPIDHHYLFSDKVSSHRNTPEFISVHSPLGRSAVMSHYDKPVPGYITEYMASYKKPPQDAYCNTPIKLWNENNNFENGQDQSDISNIADYESHNSTLTLQEQTQLEMKLYEALELLDKHHNKPAQTEEDESSEVDDDDMKKLKQKQQNSKRKQQAESKNINMKPKGSPLKINTNV